EELLAALPALLDRWPGVGIVLVGEPSLIERLEALEGRGVRFPVSAKCQLASLDAGEVAAYIDYCWHRSSAGPCPFSAAAIRRIASASRGIPQVVNSICDRALHLAEARGLMAISGELADEAAQDLILEQPGGIFARLRARVSTLTPVGRGALAGAGAVAL